MHAGPLGREISPTKFDIAQVKLSVNPLNFPPKQAVSRENGYLQLDLQSI